MIWNFTLHLKDLNEITDQLAESLYGAFADGLLSSSGNDVEIGFSRESLSLSDAIRSAVIDVRQHGLDVKSVEIEEQDLVPEEVAEWRTV